MSREGFFEFSVDTSEYPRLGKNGTVAEFLMSKSPFDRKDDFEILDDEKKLPIVIWHYFLKMIASGEVAEDIQLMEFKGKGAREQLFFKGLSKVEARELKKLRVNDSLVELIFDRFKETYENLVSITEEEIGFVMGKSGPERVDEKPKRKNEERRNWFQSIWWRIKGGK